MVTSAVWPDGSKSAETEQALKAKKHTAAMMTTAAMPKKMKGFGSRLGMMALVS